MPHELRTPLISPPLQFEDVYSEHFSFVWRSARRLGVAEGSVDDVVQEVFIIAHRKLGEFEGRSSVRTWLYAIARRVVSDFRRAQRRTNDHDELPPSLSSDAVVDGDIERQQASALLQEFLHGLPDEQAEVFILSELEQMSAPEIEAATGVTLNTVYSRVRLARAAFDRFATRYRAKERFSEVRQPNRGNV